jgi:hypothetical protein
MSNDEIFDIKENTLKGEVVRTYCNKCRQNMNHQVLMNYCESGTDILDTDFDLQHGRIEYKADFKVSVKTTTSNPLNK